MLYVSSLIITDFLGHFINDGIVFEGELLSARYGEILVIENFTVSRPFVSAILGWKLKMGVARTSLNACLYNI